MSSVREIEQAIEKLSPKDINTLRKWFAEHDAAHWDKKIQADAGHPRLNAFTDEALSEHRKGRSKSL